jgi:DNA-binding NarL/FixJ family response regulator
VEQPLHPRVLIVDDDLNIRRALHNLLEDYGVEVVGEAPDGLQAVRMAQALSPDIVIMDLRMPVLGGIDATVRLRRAVPAVKVIVCSAYTDPIVSEQAREAGAAAVVVKGDHPRELLGAVERAWHEAVAGSAWQQAVPS